jgi:exonuclease-1
VKYAIDKAEILRSKFGIDVMLVIDGDSLPSKKEENAQRREDREAAFEKALSAEKDGDSRSARRFYAQSCSVTHEIRFQLIRACKQARIAFVVAPYEADAQMARLAHTGAVDLVITEDSDILCYGCPRALFKVDFNTCQGQEIQLMKDLGENESLSFKNWTHGMFVFMCILSGCDYCKGVPGIGIKLAHRVVRVHQSPSKIFTALRAAGRMPRGFEDEFWVAFRTFRHQRVFCPSKQQIEPLFPIPGSSHSSNPIEVWPFLGEYIEPHIAARIADGTFHPSKKVEWEVALKRNISSNQSCTMGDIQIHHRSPPRKQRRKEKGTRDGRSENIWHALVYGSNGSGNDTCRLQDRRDRTSTNQTSSKDDMFRFFSKSSKRDVGDVPEIESRDVQDSNNRPPLKEIYVDENASKPKPPPPGHKDLPIHFHEYKSHLVGIGFKPISRKRGKRGNDGTKSSEVVQRIWEKSASNRNQAHSVREDIVDCHSPKKTERGIAIFSKQNNSFAIASASSLPMSHDDGGGGGYFTFRYEDTKENNPFQLNEAFGDQQYHPSRRLPSEANHHDYEYAQHHDFQASHFSSRANHNDHKFQFDRMHHSHVEQCHESSRGQQRRYDHRDHMNAHHHDSHYMPIQRNLHQKQQPYDRDYDCSRHIDLKSLASGYTTVEPESYVNESTELEHPAFFPPELETINYRQHCDFEASLQSVLAATELDHNHLQNNPKCGTDHVEDYESIGVFRVFHSHVKDRKRIEKAFEFDGVAGRDAYTIDLEMKFSGRSGPRNHSRLYENGLLSAFEEMHQL